MTKRTGDAEIAALQKIAMLMESLTPEGRLRVYQYLQDRYVDGANDTAPVPEPGE